jgi:hypothetical protein
LACYCRTREVWAIYDWLRILNLYEDWNDSKSYLSSYFQSNSTLKQYFSM